MSMPSVRFTPSTAIAPCCYQPLCNTPFSFLSYSPYYVTTTKDNTVKEKGLQEVSILRNGLLPSFYASTAE